MNIHESLLQTGARCTISAQPFEVAYVGESGIRLSSEFGGNQRHVAYETLNELIKQGDIDITYVPPTINKGMLSALTQKQNEALNRKLKYVKGVCNNHENSRSQEQIAGTIAEIANELNDKKPPATSTVAGWVKRWIEGKYNWSVFLPKLKPSRSDLSNEKPVIQEIIRKAVNDVYLNRQRNPQSAVMAEIRILVADYNANHDIPLKRPSKEKLRRYINTLDSYEVAKARNGKHYANRKFRAAGISFVAKEPLELVMADGHVMDVILVRKNDDGTYEEIGRPFLTSFIDIRTRCVLGFHISLAPFCGGTLLRALRNAIVADGDKPKGIPSKLLVDNGSDYRDSGFLRACSKLNITVEPTKPREPNTKAIKERFYKTLNTDLIHKFPGSTFSNPEDRGDYDSQELARLTIEDLRTQVQGWVEHVYHINEHRTLQRAPVDVWGEEAPKCFPNTLSEIDADILLRDEQERTLYKGMVEVHGLQWKCPALTTWEQSKRRLRQERKVIVRIDELDLSKVYVATKENPTNFHEATSRAPVYTRNLSLYEHQLLKETLKKKRIQARMARMEDKELFRLRLEYHASLGHADDKIAKRKLQRLLDHEAAERVINIQQELREETPIVIDDSPTENDPIIKADRKKPISSSRTDHDGKPMPPRKRQRQFKSTSITKRQPL